MLLLAAKSRVFLVEGRGPLMVELELSFLTKLRVDGMKRFSSMNNHLLRPDKCSATGREP